MAGMHGYNFTNALVMSALWFSILKIICNYNIEIHRLNNVIM